ncbi:hypothetical protein RCC89_08190 [Cytophagaceae bacterium ABcell3]|nr:hypothetical protein RCC89_08190 [Cytophagaceae bacterium ABcell3]
MLYLRLSEINKSGHMIPVEKHTIIKPGDVLVQPKSNEKWKVTKVEGQKFFVTNLQSQKEGFVEKNEICIDPRWHMEIGDGRGYW